jgi:hypothetical protein
MFSLLYRRDVFKCYEALKGIKNKVDSFHIFYRVVYKRKMYVRMQVESNKILRMYSGSIVNDAAFRGNGAVFKINLKNRGGRYQYCLGISRRDFFNELKHNYGFELSVYNGSVIRYSFFYYFFYLYLIRNVVCLFERFFLLKFIIDQIAKSSSSPVDVQDFIRRFRLNYSRSFLGFRFMRLKIIPNFFLRETVFDLVGKQRFIGSILPTRGKHKITGSKVYRRSSYTFFIKRKRFIRSFDEFTTLQRPRYQGGGTPPPWWKRQTYDATLAMVAWLSGYTNGILRFIGVGVIRRRISARSFKFFLNKIGFRRFVNNSGYCNYFFYKKLNLQAKAGSLGLLKKKFNMKYLILCKLQKIINIIRTKTRLIRGCYIDKPKAKAYAFKNLMKNKQVKCYSKKRKWLFMKIKSNKMRRPIVKFNFYMLFKRVAKLIKKIQTKQT